MEQDTERIDVTQMDDSASLKDAIVHLFNSHFSDVLNMISFIFPHQRGDGSDNEKLFMTYRSKILRSGNNKVRDLDEVIKEYAVKKIMDVETTEIPVGQKVQVRKG